MFSPCAKKDKIFQDSEAKRNTSSRAAATKQPMQLSSIVRKPQPSVGEWIDALTTYVTDRQLHTTADQNKKNNSVALLFPRKTARARKSSSKDVEQMLIAKSDPSAVTEVWQSSNIPAI